MRALSLLLVLFTVSFQIIGQSVNQSNQYFYKLNSSYVFCDNSPRNWCTFELETDTIIPIENNIYFCFNKSAQFTGVPFEFKNSSSPPDPFKAEEYALKAHKKWELDYQKTTFKNRLKDGEVLFLNNKGKQFLIWWFESPKKSKTPERSIEIKTKPYSNFLDSTGIEYDVTHQLFLDFIVHGSTCYSMSIPVLESETLQDEIIRLQKIANTLKIYGSFIDLNILYKRINNKNSFVFTDSKNLIEIELPDWLNIVQSPFDNAIAGSFPEVDNILNAVAITWIKLTVLRSKIL